jgi:nitrogenase-associated protein
MAHVIFYEKPGCGGNARQRQMLLAAGHSVEARSIVDTRWTPEALLGFFGSLPVADWFNRNALPVKSGDVVPERLGREQALELLAAQPMLMRRPLLDVGGERRVGFDADAVHAWIGLGLVPDGEDLEACRHKAGESCAGHDHDHDHDHGHRHDGLVGLKVPGR